MSEAPPDRLHWRAGCARGDVAATAEHIEPHGGRSGEPRATARRPSWQGVSRVASRLW